ncbi:MAG: hypothetical protein KBT34_05540 [Prevotella sp.]|nr:hypothetical protein [Candidatus Prevotella equi]
MAKTIEEYAKEYFDKNFSRIGDMHMDDGIKTVFIESAEYQHKRDIEKACEWLAYKLMHTMGETVKNDLAIEHVIYTFKQAMEE